MKIRIVFISALFTLSAAAVACAEPKKLDKWAVTPIEKELFEITCPYYEERVLKDPAQEIKFIPQSKDSNVWRVLYVTDISFAETSKGREKIYFNYQEIIISLKDRKPVNRDYRGIKSCLEIIEDDVIAQKHIDKVMSLNVATPEDFKDENCTPRDVYILEFNPYLVRVYFYCYPGEICIGRDCGYAIYLDTREDKVVIFQ